MDDTGERGLRRALGAHLRGIAKQLVELAHDIEVGKTPDWFLQIAYRSLGQALPPAIAPTLTLLAQVRAQQEEKWNQSA